VVAYYGTGGTSGSTGAAALTQSLVNISKLLHIIEDDGFIGAKVEACLAAGAEFIVDDRCSGLEFDLALADQG
jgi:hypothetical protein